MLHQCGEKIKAKCHKVFPFHYYVCGSYGKKTGKVETVKEILLENAWFDSNKKELI